MDVFRPVLSDIEISSSKDQAEFFLFYVNNLLLAIRSIHLVHNIVMVLVYELNQ